MLFRPVLEYDSSVWDLQSVIHQETLESRQTPLSDLQQEITVMKPGYDWLSGWLNENVQEKRKDDRLMLLSQS